MTDTLAVLVNVLHAVLFKRHINNYFPEVICKNPFGQKCSGFCYYLKSAGVSLNCTLLISWFHSKNVDFFKMIRNTRTCYRSNLQNYLSLEKILWSPLEIQIQNSEYYSTLLTKNKMNIFQKRKFSWKLWLLLVNLQINLEGTYHY